MATRSSDADITKSGYRFLVVAERDDLTGLGDELLSELQDETFENMAAAQALVVKEVRRTLSRASARPADPNESPRKLTGELVRSWVAGRIRWKNTERTVMEAAVESRHPAAGALEFGARRAYRRRRADQSLTKKGNRRTTGVATLGIRPHPYYRPTIVRIADELGDLMGGE